MVFLIPDNTLDTLICDSCKKYLSVKPIKIYPNNDVKCGRCSKADDEGFVSFYEILAEQILFKCINRFDGCSKLLTHWEVRNHENECTSQVVSCPVCVESTSYPTYMLRSHFKQHHQENYLEKNWFHINFDISPSNTLKWFLYNLEDHLFFIYCQYDIYVSTLALNAVYIGTPQRSKQMSQKFTIHCNSRNTICTENRPSASYYTKTNEYDHDFKIPIKNLKLERNVIVEFNLDVMNAAKPVLLPSLQTFIMPLKKISLKSNSDYYIGLNSIGLLKQRGTDKLVIYPQCKNCGCIELLNYYDKGAYTVERDVRHYVCLFCRHYYEQDKVENVENLLPLNIYKTLEFHCKWNCNYTQRLPFIIMHEEICANQTSRVCPVQNCMFFGKLYEIRKHFKRSHPSILLQMVEPLLVINRSSQTPKQCYILVSDKFVWTQYSWEGSVLNMNISLCENEDTIKPIARIFDLNDTYFGCFESDTFSIEYKLKLVIKIELKTFKK